MISITDNARVQLNKLASTNNKPTRLSIESGGCQGFNKVWSVADLVVDEDVVLLGGDLVIDEVSLAMLGTSVIDYKIDISGSYWVVEIPNASSTCGCGTSFSI